MPQGAPKSPPLPGEVGKALQIVTNPLFAPRPGRHHSANAHDTQWTRPESRLPVLDASLSGWPAGKAPEFKTGDAAKSFRAHESAPRIRRGGSLLALAERWGKKDIFSAYR